MHLVQPGTDARDDVEVPVSEAERPEVWLRGPLAGVDPLLMPAAHALLQAGEDIERAARPLSATQLWVEPGGAASIAFHLRHIAGSIDRLLTYARGGALAERQLAALAAERVAGDPPEDAAVLVAGARRAIDEAVAVIRATPAAALTEARAVGRGRLPSTVLGLLFHIAEHTQRHVGQAVTTAKIVRGLDLGR
jgi:hypothetical protein